MSEYQYYEFQAIDRTLTTAERNAISQLSSRVKPTPNRAVFTYSHGDFPGDPKRVLAQYFDIMYYIANWGTQQLAFRFPKSLISPDAIAPYCIEGAIELTFTGDWAILVKKIKSLWYSIATDLRPNRMNGKERCQFRENKELIRCLRTIQLNQNHLKQLLAARSSQQ